MIICVDLETSDLPPRGEPPAEGDPTWPFIVQAAAMLCNGDGTPIDFFHTRVRAPEGMQVRAGAEAMHGISAREAARSGVSEMIVLGMLCGFAAQARQAVGHGVDFDRRVAVNRLRLIGKPDRLITRPGLEWVDTMILATPVCRILGDGADGQYRWPSLDVACATVLEEPARDGLHSAWIDCDRTRRLFLELRRRGVAEAA